MNPTDDRIDRFRNMAEADPENDMAHFSLGNAYYQASRWDEAADAFKRCVETNDAMSKAYQLGGDAMIRAGRRDEAGEFLITGYESAASRGDLMPRDAMGELLKSLDLVPPSLSAAQAEAEAAAERLRASGAFICRRSGRPGTELSKAPLPGAVGVWIKENISAESWQEWIEQGTKVINELRLDLSNDEHAAQWDQHMCEFLGIDPSLLTQPA